MCDGGDGCPLTLTSCCKQERPRCETAETVEADGTVREIHCLLGFGCAGDAKAYLDKLTARFG